MYFVAEVLLFNSSYGFILYVVVVVVVVAVLVAVSSHATLQVACELVS